jgi:hypothetical protein
MRGNNNRRRNYNKNRFSRHNRRHDANRNMIKCPICDKPIRELISAISYKENNVPAHFDCVLREIRKNEELAANEKICYLGKGSFGIIAFRNPSSPIKFLIRKRIQYEEITEIPDWRKEIPTRI